MKMIVPMKDGMWGKNQMMVVVVPIPIDDYRHFSNLLAISINTLQQ